MNAESGSSSDSSVFICRLAPEIEGRIFGDVSRPFGDFRIGEEVEMPVIIGDVDFPAVAPCGGIVDHAGNPVIIETATRTCSVIAAAGARAPGVHEEAASRRNPGSFRFAVIGRHVDIDGVVDSSCGAFGRDGSRAVKRGKGNLPIPHEQQGAYPRLAREKSVERVAPANVAGCTGLHHAVVRAGIQAGNLKNLFLIVCTLYHQSLLPGGLQRGQEKAGENRDDCNNDKKFDKGESCTMSFRLFHRELSFRCLRSVSSGFLLQLL